MDWSNKKVLEFLDFYENEPGIWNISHPDHKTRNLVYDAWKRIQEKMGKFYTITDLKKKKESLMASFRACQNKVKESTKTGRRAGKVYRPNWFAYSKMNGFLKNNNVSKNTIKSEKNLTSQSQTLLNDEGNESEEWDIETFIQNNTNNENADFVTEGVPSTSKAVFKSIPKKKRKLLCEEDILRRKKDAAITILQKTSQEKKDFCDKYCELLAERLRQFDERTRDIAMNHIDNYLFKLKFNQQSLTSSPLPRSTSSSSSQGSQGSEY